MIRYNAAALGLAASLLAPMTAASAETIRDAALGYSITFPGEAERSELEEELPDWALEVSAWEATGSGMGITAVRTLPKGERYSDPDATLAEFKDLCFKSDKLVEEKRLDIPGGRGVDIVGASFIPTVGNQTNLLRVVVKTNKIYCATASYYEGEDAGPARAFIRSLKVD